MSDRTQNAAQASTCFVFRPIRSDIDDGEAAARGRTPRVSRMMALAIHLQKLVDTGEVSDYAELARLGEVSRARLTQIMDLTLLAPDIQEAVLFLPQIRSGRDPLSERKLRRVAANPIWACQREQWVQLAQRFSNHAYLQL